MEQMKIIAISDDVFDNKFLEKNGLFTREFKAILGNKKTLPFVELKENEYGKHCRTKISKTEALHIIRCLGIEIEDSEDVKTSTTK